MFALISQHGPNSEEAAADFGVSFRKCFAINGQCLTIVFFGLGRLVLRFCRSGAVHLVPSRLATGQQAAFPQAIEGSRRSRGSDAHYLQIHKFCQSVIEFCNPWIRCRRCLKDDGKRSTTIIVFAATIKVGQSTVHEADRPRWSCPAAPVPRQSSLGDSRIPPQHGMSWHKLQAPLDRKPQLQWVYSVPDATMPGARRTFLCLHGSRGETCETPSSASMYSGSAAAKSCWS